MPRDEPVFLTAARDYARRNLGPLPTLVSLLVQHIDRLQRTIDNMNDYDD